MGDDGAVCHVEMEGVRSSTKKNIWRKQGWHRWGYVGGGWCLGSWSHYQQLGRHGEGNESRLGQSDQYVAWRSSIDS